MGWKSSLTRWYQLNKTRVGGEAQEQEPELKFLLFTVHPQLLALYHLDFISVFCRLGKNSQLRGCRRIFPQFQDCAGAQTGSSSTIPTWAALKNPVVDSDHWANSLKGFLRRCCSLISLNLLTDFFSSFEDHWPGARKYFLSIGGRPLPFLWLSNHQNFEEFLCIFSHSLEHPVPYPGRPPDVFKT